MPRLNEHKRNSSDSRFDRRSTDGWSKEGRAVRILTQCHFKSEEYQIVFGALNRTKFSRKCPDMLVDNDFYEYEGFE